MDSRRSTDRFGFEPQDGWPVERRLARFGRLVGADRSVEVGIPAVGTLETEPGGIQAGTQVDTDIVLEPVK